MPHRLGNAQTNPVLLGGSGGQELGQLITMASSQPERTQSATAHDWTGAWTAVKVKSKTNLEKPKAKTRMRAKDQIPGNCALLCRVGSGHCCPLVSASSACAMPELGLECPHGCPGVLFVM